MDAEPSAGIHQPSSWRTPVSVESNRISSYFRPTESGVAVMLRDGLKTSCHCPCQKSRQRVAYTQSAARSSVAAKPPRIQRALASGCCGASGFFHPGGGVCLCLAKGEFVSRFKRSSTDTAQNRGAVAAHQRIMNGPRARRAPEIYRWGHLRYCWRWNTGHQFSG